MPVLLPNFASFAKLVGQVSKKEVQVLIRRWKGVFERVVDFVDGRLLRCLLDLFLEELQVGAVVRKVLLRIKIPAFLNVTRDDLGGPQRFDQFQCTQPCSMDSWTFYFFGPIACSVSLGLSALLQRIKANRRSKICFSGNKAHKKHLGPYMKKKTQRNCSKHTKHDYSSHTPHPPQ